MRNVLVHISLVFFCSTTIFAQKASSEKLWKSEHEKVKYSKERRYKGPEDWYSNSPAEMKQEEEEFIPAGGGTGTGSSKATPNSPIGNQNAYTPEEIQEERERRYGKDYSSAGGSKKSGPEIISQDPIEFPDLDAPDIDAPDIDAPDIDAPDFLSSRNFWLTILIIIVFLLLVWIIYYIIKSQKPRDKQVVIDVENDWNPEVITKTQLELMLEKASADENYRECVRVYFMFILKELTFKSWIRWKADKTNYEYLLEMRSRENYMAFEEVVRIYDLVWYGDYAITRDVYERLQPALIGYYKSLDPVNE